MAAVKRVLHLMFLIVMIKFLSAVRSIICRSKKCSLAGCKSFEFFSKIAFVLCIFVKVVSVLVFMKIMNLVSDFCFYILDICIMLQIGLAIIATYLLSNVTAVLSRIRTFDIVLPQRSCVVKTLKLLARVFVDFDMRLC